MHDHDNNKDSGHKGMMWMMVLCFLLFGVLLLGGNKLFSGGYFWPILIGVFVVAHVWMMFKGHGGHGGRSGSNTGSKIDGTPVVQSESKDEDDKK